MYDVQRRDLLESVNAILFANGLSSLSREALVQYILHGDERLPNDINNKFVVEITSYSGRSHVTLYSPCIRHAMLTESESSCDSAVTNM